MIIRADQIEALEQIATEASDARLLRHVNKYWPAHWEMIGEAQLLRVIQLAKKRAAKYGLIAEREQCLYLSVMLALGSYFDEDFQLPWVGEILDTTPYADGFTKVSALYKRAMQEMAVSNGPAGVELRQAVLRLDSIELTRATQEAEIAKTLVTVFPQKKFANESVVKHAVQRCEEYHMATVAGTLLFAGAIKLVGHGFDVDPQFPWAEKVLTATDLSAEAKTLRFRDESRKQRDLWLRHTGD